MKISEVLKEALAKIKKGWTQGCAATDKKGQVVSLQSDKAAKFCAIGAIYSVRSEVSTSAERKLREAIQQTSIVSWNDNPKRTKRQVVAAFKKAIKQVEEEENK